MMNIPENLNARFKAFLHESKLSVTLHNYYRKWLFKNGLTMQEPGFRGTGNKPQTAGCRTATIGKWENIHIELRK